jgi:tRNA dimethylallyltransferase
MLTIDVKPTRCVRRVLASLTCYKKLGSPTEVLRARRKVVCAACTLDTSQPFMVEDGAQLEAHRRSRAHRRYASRDKKMHGRPAKRRATVHSDVPTKVDAEASDQEDQHHPIV